MTRFVLDTSELDDLAAAIRVAPERALKQVRAAGIVVGERVKNAAQEAAPADRPWLKQHGIRQRTWTDRNGSHTDISTVRDGRGRNVGFFVEYGTAGSPPNPFLTSQMLWAGQAFLDEAMRRLDPFSDRGTDAG